MAAPRTRTSVPPTEIVVGSWTLRLSAGRVAEVSRLVTPPLGSTVQASSGGPKGRAPDARYPWVGSGRNGSAARRFNALARRPSISEVRLRVTMTRTTTAMTAYTTATMAAVARATRSEAAWTHYSRPRVTPAPDGT